jgi:tetratricopeptide (TPR) repeat protein
MNASSNQRQESRNLMKIDATTVEKYQKIIEKDPQSQVFAPLAEAYREMKMLEEAKRVVTAGVQRHPQFVAGLVTYARIMRDLGEFEKSLEALKKAIQLSPENLLAHQLLAETHLVQKNPKEALKAFKMLLFLNPHSKTAQKAVQKLESLTADEYDEEVFSMTKLPEVQLEQWQSKAQELKDSQTNSQIKLDDLRPIPRETPSVSRAMERMLSLIDAFIVRNDLEKANALLKDTRVEFGEHPEISKRMKTLQVRYNEPADPTPLKPLAPRHQLIRERKIEVLNMMLRKIEEYRAHLDLR